MFNGHFATSTAPGGDGLGLATWAGVVGGGGETVYARGGGVITVGVAGVAGVLCGARGPAGPEVPGAIGPGGGGEGLVTWSFTAGRDGPPRDRVVTVIPAATRTTTATTTAHCAPVSLRNPFIRRLPTPSPDSRSRMASAMRRPGAGRSP
jgi:hypothetical protein